jgi:hypothetical protein
MFWQPDGPQTRWQNVPATQCLEHEVISFPHFSSSFSPQLDRKGVQRLLNEDGSVVSLKGRGEARLYSNCMRLHGYIYGDIFIFRWLLNTFQAINHEDGYYEV